ncbi:MAG: molybdopterin molybdotransferase [Gaiellaceae bacterium]|nr:molybdopterin molybdotransferase [Gaiellaceae bacterium]
MDALLPLEDAIAAVLAEVRPLGAERVALADALGRVLAEPALSATDLPPFPSSSMDGFALRAADTPGVLAVVGHSAAGVPWTGELGAGQAVGIATGAVVPAVADAVIPIERVVVKDNSVEVEACERGANIRLPGGDVERGAVVLPAGSELGAAQLAALAAAGVPAVACARRPRVRVLVTGTELRAAGEELRPGEIYESNGTLIRAALSGEADVELLAPVRDDEAAHTEALARALEADVALTSGGVSVGPHDLVRAVAAGLGVTERFWRVAVKPGKPVLFGTRGHTLLFGLPGNPVSVLVGLELFVRPALRALQGTADPGPRFEPARLARPARLDPARTVFLRARLEDGVVDPLSGQESHMIVRAAAANALVHLPRGEGELAAGEPVRIIRLR